MDSTKIDPIETTVEDCGRLFIIPKLKHDTCAGVVTRSSKQNLFLAFQINQSTIIGKYLKGTTYGIKHQFLKQSDRESPYHKLLSFK